jgi:hypothetical protein
MMRLPDENLDDFTSKAAAPKPEGPPSFVWLYPTGEIEVLQPLARYEGFIKTKAATATAAANPHPRFPRSLAVAAALAMTALILGTGLLIGYYAPHLEPVSPIDVAADQSPADTLTSPEEPGAFDLLSTLDSPSAFDGVVAVRKVIRTRRVHARVFQSVYRPRRFVALPRPRLIVSNFVPTTLIIYIDNGEIKTRIEPQLTAGYKKPSPLP